MQVWSHSIASSKDRQQMFCTQIKILQQEGICIFWSGHIEPSNSLFIKNQWSSLKVSDNSDEDTVEKAIATAPQHHPNSSQLPTSVDLISHKNLSLFKDTNKSDFFRLVLSVNSFAGPYMECAVPAECYF